MSAGRKTFLIATLSVAAVASMAVPETYSLAASSLVEPKPAAVVGAEAPIQIAPATAESQPAMIATDTTVADAGAEPALQVNEADPELVCMAKVVRHEAANQPRDGQLAVAQLIMNRLRSPKFPKTVCGVVHQAGQFFNTNTYNPSRNDRMWRTAMDVSIEARNAMRESVIGNAIYYNAARTRSAFHAGRKLAATIGDHAFYH
ncbi:spore germination cell wall hydrolase CwlJ-like protein [Sphingomonas zeicaulis]|uniref:cell wall hydrolase n=1 Tax=Sphingomonas zeicaulis TaxID=1632740 RepID=UPI003D218D5C